MYICIRLAGPKYVVHPATEQAYQQSVDKQETDVWYYSTKKDINDFATANVFGAYDSLAEAKAAIMAIDPEAVYKPPGNIA
ncbi:hypothetical protein HY768_02165 [candidate division TA06 bacterium]|uniref:Uncharacterized protein n=1 Tax=candidate division TA06 bacterium TaxID=2250710 RepID=A0A933IB30_UNCT6|nr:hypothetical protein [candidate division TA06 bacterium]